MSMPQAPWYQAFRGGHGSDGRPEDVLHEGKYYSVLAVP